MKPLVFNLFGEHPLMQSLVKNFDFSIGNITLRNFPDGETYIKFNDSLMGKEIIILDSLDRPNSKILPLLFVAKTAKELGAKRVGLCAPYLAYMRQDKQFNLGEGITSNYFAELLSHYFDWLVTVDPHLHRHSTLSEIYSIPNRVIHAAPAIAKWVKANVNKPVFIGPDVESEQWVSDVANQAKAPYIILQKSRYGDQNVNVSIPNVSQYKQHIPVLVDDIISTAHTMIETVRHLKTAAMPAVVCIGVHAIFAGNAYKKLEKENVAMIATCNTISHISNKIDLSAIILTELKQLRGD